MANELFSSGERAVATSQERFGVAQNMASNVVEFPSANTEKNVENTTIDANAYSYSGNNVVNMTPMQQAPVQGIEPFVVQQNVDWNNKISGKAAGKAAKQVQAEIHTGNFHKAQDDFTNAKRQFGVIQRKAA